MKDIYEGLARRTEGLLSDVKRASNNSKPKDDIIDRVLQYGKEITLMPTPHGFEAPIRFNAFEGEWSPYERPTQTIPQQQSGMPFNQSQQGFTPSFGSMIPGYRPPVGREEPLAPTQQHTGAPYKPQTPTSFSSMSPSYRPIDNTIPAENYKLEGSISDMNKQFFQGNTNISAQPVQPVQEQFQGLANYDRWEGIGSLLSRTFGKSPEGDPSLIAQAAYGVLDAANDLTKGLWKGTSVLSPIEGESKFKMKEGEGLGSYLTRFFGTSPEGEPSLLSQDINQLLDAIENTKFIDIWKGIKEKPKPYVVDTTGMSEWEKRGVKAGEITKEVGKFVEDVYITQALSTLGVPSPLGFGATRASRSFWEERDIKEAAIVGSESAIFSAVLGKGSTIVKKFGLRYLDKLPPAYRDSLALDFTVRLLSSVIPSPVATTASYQVREPLSVPEAETIIRGAVASFFMGLYSASLETARFRATPSEIQKINKYQGELLKNQAIIENNPNITAEQKAELLKKIYVDRTKVLEILENIYKADRVRGLSPAQKLENLERVRTLHLIKESKYEDSIKMLLSSNEDIATLHKLRKLMTDDPDFVKNLIEKYSIDTYANNKVNEKMLPSSKSTGSQLKKVDTTRMPEINKSGVLNNLVPTASLSGRFDTQLDVPNFPKFQTPSFTKGEGTNLPDYFKSLIPKETEKDTPQVPTTTTTTTTTTTEPTGLKPIRPADTYSKDEYRELLSDIEKYITDSINNPNISQVEADDFIDYISNFIDNFTMNDNEIPENLSGTLKDQIDQLTLDVAQQNDMIRPRRKKDFYGSDLSLLSRIRHIAGLPPLSSEVLPAHNQKLMEQLISSGEYIETPDGFFKANALDNANKIEQITGEIKGISKAIGDNKGIISKGIARDKSALRDKIVNLARAGNVSVVRQALGQIRQAQSNLSNPIFDDKSTIWQLEKVARDIKTKKRSTIPTKKISTDSTKPTTKVPETTAKSTKPTTKATKPKTEEIAKATTKATKPKTEEITKAKPKATKPKAKSVSTDSTKEPKVARLSTDSKNKVHRIRPQSAIDPVFEEDLKKYGYKYNESTKAWEAPIKEGSAKDLEKLTNKHISRFVDAKSIKNASQLPDTVEGLNEYIKQYAKLEKKGFTMDLQLFATAKRKLSKLSGTVRDLSYMKDPFTQALIIDADLNYKTKTNEASMQRALSNLDNDYYGEYNRLMTEGIKTAEDSVAAGIILRDLKELAYETGDFDKMTSFLKKIQSDYTNMGQALQAIVTWSDDTVEGSLMRAEKIIQKIVTEDKKTKPGKHKRKDEDIKNSKKEVKESKKEFSREIQKSVDKLIREGLTFPSGKVPSPSNKESMVKWINDWYETGRFKRKDFIEKIVEEQKLSLDDAKKLNDELYSKLKDITKTTKDRLLERAMKDKPQKEEKKRATEKLTRLVNQGLLENKKFENKVSDKLSPIIKEVMRDNNISLQEVVKLSLSEQLSAKRKALKDVFNNVRVDDTEINTLVNTISYEFDKIAKSKKESMLLAMAKETKPPKPAKTPIEKLEEKINLGLYDEGIDESIQNAILDKYNLPYLSSEDIKYINDRFKELDKLPKDSWAYRAIQSQIKNVVADKMPTDIVTKMAAIQRINLLGNVKTFSRNFTSIFHGGLEAITQDTIGVLIDRSISSIRNSPRTRYFDPKNKLKDFKKDWASSFKDTMRDIKYGTETRRFESYDYIQPSSPFSNNNIIGKALNRVGKVIGKAQESGDRPFQEAEYNIKVKELMKAEGVTEPTKEIKEKALEHTIDRFLYRNAALYRASIKTKNMFDNTAWKMFTQLLMPFTKFSGNAVERTLDYQGLGFVKAIGHASKVASGRAEFNQKYFVDSLTRGATGLGLMAAGAGLAAAGILNIESTDKKIKEFQKEQGILGNSFKIGNKYYSFDYIGPFMPSVMLGAVIYDAFKGEDPDLVSSILDGFANQLDILYKQPTLELAQKMYKYNKTFVEAVTETVIDHVVSQSVPTIVKQTASWIDDKERQYWDSEVFKRAVSRYMYSLPIIRQELTPKYGVLGDPIESYGNNFFESFINPSINGEYIKGKDAVVDEILSLIDEGYTIQIPTLPNKKITRTHPETKEKFEWNLDHEEYADLAYLQGTYSKILFGNLMQLPIYIDAPSEYKAAMLKEVLKEVRDASVQQFLVEKGYMTESGYSTKESNR